MWVGVFLHWSKFSLCNSLHPVTNSNRSGVLLICYTLKSIYTCWCYVRLWCLVCAISLCMCAIHCIDMLLLFIWFYVILKVHTDYTPLLQCRSVSSWECVYVSVIVFFHLVSSLYGRRNPERRSNRIFAGVVYVLEAGKRTRCMQHGIHKIGQIWSHHGNRRPQLV